MMFDESPLTRPLPHRPFMSSISAPTFPTFTNGNPNPNSRSSSSKNANPRFSPFSQNPRIAIALVPAALFLLDLGGSPVVATLTIGLMLSYILDSLRIKSASFFGLWFSLLASQTAFFFNSSLFPSLPLSLLALALSGLTTFLIGVWSSLQFRWIQIENPSIILALERLLFACLPIIAPVLFTWASISSVGLTDAAAYYFSTFSIVFYWLFSLPRPSSFKPKQEFGGPGAENFILGPLESCLHALHLLFLPLLFRIASHHAVLFSSTASIADLLLLFFVPFLFLLYASTRGALWWVTGNAHQLQQIRIMNGAVALVVVVLCLEVRVVFHSFGRYLHVPPPWNYVLVTFTMLGGASAAGGYAVGLINDAFGSVVFTTLSIVVSATGAIVVGFPLLFLPLPLLSGFCLAQFFTRKSLPSYFAFVVFASLMVTWFVVHNFWDLNIWLADMALKSFCKLIVVSVVMAMAVPGFALLPSKFHFVTELGLISHALLLCYIENRFFNYTGIYYFGFEGDVIYPSYMVILTTFLGLALVRRLVVDHRIGPKAVWILTCLYSSKLAMLFITSKSVLWVSAVLLLAISPPLLLYKDRSRVASKMKSWQGFAHAGVIALSAWLCRETIFEALQWWNGRPPSDGLLLGFYILLTGLACIPIVALHFSHVQSAKRFLVLVVATGLLFILMQPPIPLSWAFNSDMIRAAHQSADDITIYGFVASKPSWPSWLLITTILLTLAAVTSIIPIKYIVELRAFYAVGVGITLGIYICAEYFLQATILHALLVATIVCASVFLIFTHLPSASSTRLLPWVFALLVALFPVTYLLEGQLRVKNIGEGEGDKLTTLLAIEGARMSLLGLYASLFMLIALEIKFELASLMREKALDRGVQNQMGRSSGFPPKLRLVQQRKASTAPSFTVKRLAAEGAWMPAVGNVSTILCFAICLILNINFTGGSNRAIFFLAPILLLLNQDTDFIAGFGDRQRYFPVTVVISGYLVLSALYRIFMEVWHGDVGWGLEIGGPGWFFAVKNLALLILTLPNHILFNRFMWDYAKQTDAMLLLTMPLNLPSIIITDIITVKVLGLLGVIYSLAQYLISRQIRIAGMKYI
ncbi:no exine formation 1 [Tasmannia lanceolata]|uniref:no exine formation 1 n=1 Tax=Tasmannia lanceolata TaxID=3420 RepID=UPI0040641D81